MNFPTIHKIFTNPNFENSRKTMTGLDIVMVFAVILFARLGFRLVAKYLEMKKQKREDQDKN